MIEDLKEDVATTTSFSITGGQNVIAPNATTASQNIYGNQETEKLG